MVRVAEVTLRDGRSELPVRRIGRADAARLRAFHEKTSAETQRQRFRAWHPRLSRREVDWLTNVDHARREALVALEGDEIVAVARYDRRSGDVAEATLVVRDDYQGRGLGAALLRQLIGLAKGRGIRQLYVDTLPGNARMWGAAHDTGYPCIESYEKGLVRTTIVLDRPLRIA